MSAALPGAPERVSMIEGDRLCARCGYNLAGQPVLREPHYEMLIARCPECGTVASVQEYPSLGRWASAWSRLLAGLWLLLVLSVFFSAAFGTVGLGIATVETGGQNLRNEIYTQYTNWLQQQTRSTQSAAVNSFPTGTDPFLNQLDLDAVFAEIGGWRGGVDWMCLLILLPLVVVAGLEGCLIAVLFVRLRRVGLLLTCACCLLLDVLLAAGPMWGWLFAEPSNYWNAAYWVVGPRLMVIVLLATVVAMVLGAVLGRPLMRHLLRFSLPPRLLTSMALLWESDGLTPPGLKRPQSDR